MEAKKLIGAIIGVIAFIALIAGATFAYWQWTSNSAQRTNIKLNVASSVPMGASLDGGGSIQVANLAPASCTNSTYALKKEITLTYYNETPQNASIRGTLTLSNPHQAHAGTLRLNNLHYALTTGTNAGNSCTSGTIVVGGNNSAFPAFTNGTKIINDIQLKVAQANSGTAQNQLTETYYLWVWIDSSDNGSNVGSTVTDPMQDLSFTLTWTGRMVTISQ